MAIESNTLEINLGYEDRQCKSCGKIKDYAFFRILSSKICKLCEFNKKHDELKREILTRSI